MALQIYFKERFQSDWIILISVDALQQTILKMVIGRTIFHSLLLILIHKLFNCLHIVLEAEDLKVSIRIKTCALLLFELMSNRQLHANTASKNKTESPMSINSVEDDIVHHKLRFTKQKPRGSKLNLMAQMNETPEQSRNVIKHSRTEPIQQTVEMNPDCSFFSFCPSKFKDITFSDPKEEGLTCDQNEPANVTNNDSIMTFKNFQGPTSKSRFHSFAKKPELDISLETLISTNILIEPLSPKSKPHKEHLKNLEELFDKSDIGELKPVNVFHYVGNTYKLDLVKQGLSGMLGKLDKQ